MLPLPEPSGRPQGRLLGSQNVSAGKSHRYDCVDTFPFEDTWVQRVEASCLCPCALRVLPAPLTTLPPLSRTCGYAGGSKMG